MNEAQFEKFDKAADAYIKKFGNTPPAFEGLSEEAQYGDIMIEEIYKAIELNDPDAIDIDRVCPGYNDPGVII